MDKPKPIDPIDPIDRIKLAIDESFGFGHVVLIKSPHSTKEDFFQAWLGEHERGFEDCDFIPNHCHTEIHFSTGAMKLKSAEVLCDCMKAYLEPLK